jgi:3,4-dihydroxy-2-butanone 4-phosphate synthase
MRTNSGFLVFADHQKKRTGISKNNRGLSAELNISRPD